jgi:hypothetical protein
MFDLKLDDIKAVVKVVIDISKGTYNVIKWICCTLVACVGMIAVAIGIKKRSK